MPTSSRRRRQAVHDNPSGFWMRFWIPVLVSLGLTPILFCLGVGPYLEGLLSHSSGHKTLAPLAILFPILFPFTTMLIFNSGFVHSNLTFIVAFFLLPIVQFPVYGILLGFANTKRILIPGACVLFVIHLLAVGFIFMNPYYGPLWGTPISAITCHGLAEDPRRLGPGPALNLQRSRRGTGASRPAAQAVRIGLVQPAFAVAEVLLQVPGLLAHRREP